MHEHICFPKALLIAEERTIAWERRENSKLGGAEVGRALGRRANEVAQGRFLYFEETVHIALKDVLYLRLVVSLFSYSVASSLRSQE